MPAWLVTLLANRKVRAAVIAAVFGAGGIIASPTIYEALGGDQQPQAPAECECECSTEELGQPPTPRLVPNPVEGLDGG